MILYGLKCYQHYICNVVTQIVFRVYDRNNEVDRKNSLLWSKLFTTITVFYVLTLIRYG